VLIRIILRFYCCMMSGNIILMSFFITITIRQQHRHLLS